MLKFLSLCFLLIASLIAPNAYSIDLGVQGSVYKIEEEDLLEYILAKTDEISLPDQEKSRKIKIESFTPQRVQIGEACENRVYFYDPTVKIQTDIKDHEGNVVVKKGTFFNSLKTISLDQDLLFFDSNKKEHLKWAMEQGSNVKWILVNGNPIELEKQLNRPIYFDQFGVITKKLSIQNVPAKVSQNGLKLKIEEVYLEGANEE